MIHLFPFQLMLFLLLPSKPEGHLTKQLEISAGHAFPLECNPYVYEDHVIVRWSLGLKENLEMDSLPDGLEIINKTLWFFPAQTSHSGNYTCTFWSSIKTRNRKNVQFSISVSNQTCATSSLDYFMTKDISEFLKCDFNHINEVLRLDPHPNVTWMKDCSPLCCHKNSMTLRFPSVKESDKGKYTCSVNFTHKGNLYTAATTMNVDVVSEVVPQKPRVVKPQQEVHTVQVGLAHKLNCRVFIGTDGEDFAEPTKPYWIVGNEYADNTHFVINTSCMSEDNGLYCNSDLTILQVKPEFLQVPFMCIVLNSKGTDNGTVILVPASQSALYSGVALLGAYTVVILVFLVFYFFKVDLVLAYRKLNPCSKRSSDGKLYDAYVSHAYGNDHSVTPQTNFALHILPEVLENHLGYRLFISGRDEPPGAAVHDVISETIGKSRRLIVILTSCALSKPTNSARAKLLEDDLSINNKQIHPIFSNPVGTDGSNWGPYEWWVGLYDALIKQGIQVILVQVGGEVDEAQLPESLRYIKRTQGVLRWKAEYTTKPNGKFWKQLHYRMPLVHKANLSTCQV